uniref:CAP domain-containing protein (inferred by orthology to a zebrafish protein) n=1 Tax=Strongyloides venezuelensis TaxID=75913 RepID=A0A0K0FD06_STRVS
MKFYIIFLILINTLLAINPPPLPVKTKNYANVGIPPPLPMKRNSYVITDHNNVLKVQSQFRHSVVTYYVRGKQLFECDDKLLLNYKDAFKYCQIANEFEESKFGKNHRNSRRSHSFRRNSLIRSNSDLTDIRNSNSRLSDLSMGRKDSLSGSRNALLGLSKSSSSQSLKELKKHLSLRKSSVSGSNNDIWVRRNSVSETTSNLSSKRDSLFGSNKSLILRKNSITGSTGSLSKNRKSSLSRSRESLNGNSLDKEENKKHLDKYTDKKPKSHQIWLRVWSRCDVKCYSKQYYEKFKSLVFTEINLYRQLHKAIPLVLNAKLEIIAQELVDKYSWEKKLDIDNYYYYGVLYGNSRITSASKIIKSWYDTNDKYNFLLGKKISPAALSFTQIVWASTTQLGIGVQHEDDHIFVVCIFYPKGNIKKEYKKNVHKWIN